MQLPLHGDYSRVRDARSLLTTLRGVSGAARLPLGDVFTGPGLEWWLGTSHAGFFSLFSSAGAGSLPWQPTSETCQHQEGPAGPQSAPA